MTSRRSVTTAGARELTSVVNRLRRALRRSVRTEFADDARPVAQVEVLQMLGDTGPVRLGDLAIRLHLARSTVSALVGVLVMDGLVDRATDSRDRRAAAIELTTDGRAYVREWEAAHRRRISAALRTLADADRNAIAAAVPALRHLVEALDADPVADRPGSAR
jgi:DNA-binding MarR family transcriptional regulator